MNIEQLIDMIKSSTDCNREINEDSVMGNDLGLCSFDMINIIVSLEQMNIQVDFDKVHGEMTVREFYESLVGVK